MKLLGINIEIHWSWWALVAFFTALRLFSGGIADVAATCILPTSVMFIILGHEFAHALTARYFGYETRKIVINLFGGVAILANTNMKSRENFWISLAGPAFNIALWFVCFIVLLINPLGFASTTVGTLLSNFGIFNLIVGLFNLLPAYPMDGGRIIRALMAGQTKRRIINISHTISAIIGLLLILSIPFTGNIFIVVIAVFIFSVIWYERKMGMTM